jgi:hypothetical protein
MQFPQFWDAAGRQPDGPATPAGEGAAIVDEVVAFLAGRLVDHYAATGQGIPAWVALNRLAHADRAELASLLTGRVAVGERVTWAGAERLIAVHLLTRALTPEALAEVQRDVLVPLEALLVDRWKREALDVDEVMASAVEALRSSPTA